MGQLPPTMKLGTGTPHGAGPKARTGTRLLLWWWGGAGGGSPARPTGPHAPRGSSAFLSV